MTSKPQILVGNRSGSILAEIDAEIGPISWRLNEIGQTVLFISRTNNKLDPEILKKNNRVSIKFDNGLSWGGIISFPVRWTLDGVEVTVKTPSQLLKKRTTNPVKTFSAATAGGIVSGLIDDLNSSAYPINIDIGNIDGTGPVFSPTYNLANIRDTIKAVTQDWTTKDFDILTNVINGQIQFTLNMYDQRGTNKPTVEFIQGHNIVDIELVEQGPPINYWYVIGGGAIWDDRIVATAFDTGSIDKNGISENTKFETAITAETELQAIADNLLARTANLSNIYSLSVLNKDPAKFTDFILGDIVQLYAPNLLWAGLDQAVRIIGKEYDPNHGVMTLIVEDWQA